MEFSSELAKSLRERISNPLIFSFLWSWTIINWKIPVALFWFNAEALNKEGYPTLIRFISAQINTNNCLTFPFICAIAYTLGMPPVKTLIRSFNTWIERWSNKWNLKIAQTGSISVNKFIQLKEANQKITNTLLETIASEKSIADSLNIANANLAQMTKNLEELTDKLLKRERQISQSQNLAMLNGTWKSHYEFQDGTKGDENIYINNGQYYVFSSLGEKEQKFDIKNFYFNEQTGEIFLIKELIETQKRLRPKDEHFSINRLRLETADYMVGLEQGTTKIAYRRSDRHSPQ